MATTESKTAAAAATPPAGKVDPAQAQQDALAANEEAQRKQAEADEAARVAADAKARASGSRGPRAAIVGSDAKEETVALTLVRVLITRNEFTQVPDQVFEHELPLLRAMHGPDFVREVDRDTVEVANFDANDELARLQRKYRNPVPGSRDVVSEVYANDPRRVAEEAGVKFTSGQARKPKASSQTKPKKRVIGSTKR